MACIRLVSGMLLGGFANWANSLCGENSKSLLGFYPIINNCNRAILSIREGKALGKFATDAEYAARSLSEALFNRAYSVYIMSTMYGAIYVPQGYTTELLPIITICVKVFLVFIVC